MTSNILAPLPLAKMQAVPAGSPLPESSSWSSVVSEDLSRGTEAVPLRVTDQYQRGGHRMAPFVYITKRELVQHYQLLDNAIESLSAEEEKQAAAAAESSNDSGCKARGLYPTMDNNVLHFRSAVFSFDDHQAEFGNNNKCPILQFTHPTIEFRVTYTPYGCDWSLMTLDDIPAGTVLFEYVGLLAKDDGQTVVENSDYLLRFIHAGQEFLLDARQKGNLARFVNHSCRPNCCALLARPLEGGIPRVLIYSTKFIRMCTELGLDYGEEWWLEKAKASSLKGCCCGYPDCKYDERWCARVAADHPSGDIPRVVSKYTEDRWSHPAPRISELEEFKSIWSPEIAKSEKEED